MGGKGKRQGWRSGPRNPQVPRSDSHAGRLALVFAAALTVSLPLTAFAQEGETADPRISLIDFQLRRDYEAALVFVERRLSEDPEGSRALGLDYLRAHLLLSLDRRTEALEAFARTMSVTPMLSPYSRFRLAVEQEDLGHPEVAAGLVATLLRTRPPRELVSPAVELLSRTVTAGGDCRLLQGLEAYRFQRRDRRELLFAVAECRAREGSIEEAASIWIHLLEEQRDDPVARSTAERIVAAGPEKLAPRTEMLVGSAFYDHREFKDAIHHLARALVQVSSARNLSRREIYELRYALARSHFWEGRYEEAAAAFRNLADATRTPELKAQALYQEGRCHELQGHDERAIEVFREAYLADLTGGWADSSLISGLRLHWLAGRRGEALQGLEDLYSRRKLGTASRALVFLASSELVEGRSEDAADWLEKAERLRRVAPAELRYWQGRLEELRGRPEAAVGSYLAALVEDPMEAFGPAARRHLEAAALAPLTLRRARELAASDVPSDLYRAWLLLKPGTPLHRRTEAALHASFARNSAAASFLGLEVEPTAAWPLWQAEMARPEEMLVGLGLFDEGAAEILRHFPVTQPGLAFTGSVVLARSGDVRRSLYIAEILLKRVPRDIPQPLLPIAFQRLLYPMSHRDVIRAEAARRNVDPYLLTAIIREESRFDPRAFSAAAARGLTQFIFTTAREIAEAYEIGPVEPRDLERPEVSIALGAAYLSQLYEELDGSVPQVVAAYNAGEPQAALWRRYCLSDEPEEYLSKVAFRETRGYLVKVLKSREQYVRLYPPPAE